MKTTPSFKTSRPWLAAVLASSALLVGLAGVPAAQAAPRGHGHAEGGMMGMGRGMERMLDQVNATAEQRAQLRQIGDAARADMQADREAQRALRDQMREIFTQPTVDANAVEALRQQMLAQHDRRSQRSTQAMLEASRVLTPEQRQQMAEKMKQRGERMRERQREHRQDRRSGAGPTS